MPAVERNHRSAGIEKTGLKKPYFIDLKSNVKLTSQLTTNKEKTTTGDSPVGKHRRFDLYFMTFFNNTYKI